MYCSYPAAPPGTAATPTPSCNETCATWRASVRWTSIPHLLDMAAGQTARLFNLSELAGPFQVSRPTIRDYVTLLERIFLLERDTTLSGVEVKAAATVADFRWLRKLTAAAGKRFASGVVLYDGETTAGFGDRLYAVPIRALWEAES